MHRCARDCQEESVYSAAPRSRWPASFTSYRQLQRSCEVVASQIPFRRGKKKMGQQLKRSEYTNCGDPFHLIIAPFELFNTNAESLVVASGGGVSGISEGRWGENITVQIKPWVLNFKDEMHYSWLITPGSDCMSTNCKWRGIDKCTTNTTHLKCKYFY